MFPRDNIFLDEAPPSSRYVASAIITRTEIEENRMKRDFYNNSSNSTQSPPMLSPSASPDVIKCHFNSHEDNGIFISHKNENSSSSEPYNLNYDPSSAGAYVQDAMGPFVLDNDNMDIDNEDLYSTQYIPTSASTSLCYDTEYNYPSSSRQYNITGNNTLFETSSQRIRQCDYHSCSATPVPFNNCYCNNNHCHNNINQMEPDNGMTSCHQNLSQKICSSSQSAFSRPQFNRQHNGTNDLHGFNEYSLFKSMKSKSTSNLEREEGFHDYITSSQFSSRTGTPIEGGMLSSSRSDTNIFQSLNRDGQNCFRFFSDIE